MEKKVRIQFDFTEDQMNFVDTLKEKRGVSRKVIVDNAISLYDLLVNSALKGMCLTIRTPDGEEMLNMDNAMFRHMVHVLPEME